MFTSKNNTTVLIGKTSNTRTASVQITNPTAAAYIADGEIVVLDNNGIPLTAAISATTPKIRLVQRSGATATTCRLNYSPWIPYDKLISAKANTYDASQEQIWVLGYDGVTASTKLGVSTDLTDFMINIKYTHDIDVWSEQSAIKTYLTPYSTSIAQSTVAADLVKQVNADPSSLVTATHLNAAAGTAIGAAADTVVGSAGSTNLVITDTGGDNSVIALVAGDYIRIGTAVTDPIYKIASGSSLAITGGTVILESPLVSSVNLLGTTAEYITAAQAAAANSGIKLTGKSLYWELGQFRYLKTRFKATYKAGFTGSTTTKTQEAKLGNGVYEQVAELEWFAKGTSGALNRSMIPINPTFALADATSGSTYDTISIDFYDTFDMNSTITNSGPQSQQIVIFLGVSAPQNKGSDQDVADALEDWMSAKFGLTNLSANIT